MESIACYCQSLGVEAVSTSDEKRKHFFDDPRNVRLVLRSLYTVCAVVFLLDLVNLGMQLLDAGELRHAHHAWEHLPGFHAIYGFVACVALVLIAKELRKILMRDEDFYDR